MEYPTPLNIHDGVVLGSDDREDDGDLPVPFSETERGAYLERARAIRLEAKIGLQAQVSPITIAHRITERARDWLVDLIVLALETYPGPVPPFSVLGFGSVARGEMCPWSDMDIAFMVDGPDVPPMQALVGHLETRYFARLRPEHGGIAVDKVLGEAVVTPERMAGTTKSRDLVEIYSTGEDDLMSVLWNALGDRSERRAKLYALDVMRLSATSVGRRTLGSPRGTNLKVLLHAISQPVSRLAAYLAVDDPNMPLGTVERLQARPLVEGTTECFGLILSLRHALHLASGSETDVQPSSAELSLRLEPVLRQLSEAIDSFIDAEHEAHQLGLRRRAL